MKSIPALVTATALLVTSAHAESVVFSADFDAETPGLNTAPSGFNLTRGNTDLLGSGVNGTAFDLQPGNGYYVSLVGTGADNGAAALATNEIFEAGEYLLTFDLTGNSQAATDEIVTVGLGAFSQSIQLDAADFDSPFELQSFTFTTDTAGALTFETIDSPGEINDELGALIDNITLSLVAPAAAPAGGSGTVTAVPSPAALPAGILGLSALLIRRRRA